MTIRGIYDRVKALDTDKVAVDALTETSDARINKNREQMSLGLNSEGSIIGVYANSQYAAYKQAIGSQAGYGIVDLKLTKSFQTQIRSSVTNNSIVTDSTDSKSGDLQAKYGNVFGLSTEFRIEYISQSLRPAFNAKISAQLGLNFK